MTRHDADYKIALWWTLASAFLAGTAVGSVVYALVVSC